MNYRLALVYTDNDHQYDSVVSALLLCYIAIGIALYAVNYSETFVCFEITLDFCVCNTDRRYSSLYLISNFSLQLIHSSTIFRSSETAWNRKKGIQIALSLLLWFLFHFGFSNWLSVFRFGRICLWFVCVHANFPQHL